MLIAERELGVLERVGHDDNPRIVEYLRTVQLPAAGLHDETPWCSAFVNWTITQAGMLGTNLANARSWLYWGQPLQVPRFGCIAVFSSTRGPASGHVGFYVSTHKAWRAHGATSFNLLGGNQDNRVSRKNYPQPRLLGFRWPISVRP
jgi:uncharacterized protein (TIGR02594 family)